MSAEAEFYKKHYAGGVGIGATPLEVFAREMLGPGKRYGLVAEHILMREAAGGCFAEIGCGGGEALLILAKARHFDRIRGVDIALAPPCGQRGDAEAVEFLSANLNAKWPFRDGEVDHLIAMMVIEHLFDPFHAFCEIKRCLSSRGSAYINLPLVTGLRNRARLLVGQSLKQALVMMDGSNAANGMEIIALFFTTLDLRSCSILFDLVRSCSILFDLVVSA